LISFLSPSWFASIYLFILFDVSKKFCTEVGVVIDDGTKSGWYEDNSRDNLSAEILAVGEGVKAAQERCKENYVFATDSLLAVELLHRASLHKMVEMMRHRVKILTGIGSKLALRWKSTESQVLKKAYQDGGESGPGGNKMVGKKGGSERSGSG